MQEHANAEFVHQQLVLENETLKRVNDQLRSMYCRLLRRHLIERYLPEGMKRTDDSGC